MSQEQLISYGIMAAGALVTIYSSYKIIQKGFLLWLILSIIGVTAVNYGYNNQGAVSLNSFLDNLNPAKISKISKDQLVDICNKIESADLNKFK